MLLAVCKIRGRRPGTKPRKTTRRGWCRVGIYICALIPPSSLHRCGIHAISSSCSSGSTALAPLSRSIRFLLSRSSDSAPPDFLLLCTSYVRICPSLLSPRAIVPPDFFDGETDRGVIYRACSWLPEPPGDLAFWD